LTNSAKYGAKELVGPDLASKDMNHQYLSIYEFAGFVLRDDRHYEDFRRDETAAILHPNDDEKRMTTSRTRREEGLDIFVEMHGS
jgi:hypothetical protein